MKVTLSIALASAALAGLATKSDDGTTGTATGQETEGKLRIAILNTDGSVLNSQDVDDSSAASEAVFTGVAAGSYTASAQRLTSDGLELSTPLTQSFTVTDTSSGSGTGATVKLPAGITVNVEADDAAQQTPAADQSGTAQS